MQFEKEQLEIAKRLTTGAAIYQNCYLSDTMFKEQFANEYQALVCFISNYAYERQGAAAAYPVIAERAIEKVFHKEIKSVTHAHVQMAWGACKEIATDDFNNLQLNATHNPMHSQNGILAIMAEQGIHNIALHIKGLIEKDKTREAHELIDSVRGIGPKIASFYLRDIVYLAKLTESKIKDQFYLQPVDTWLEQALSIIFGARAPTKLREQQEIIVNLCKEADCSPIAFNQGAWVLGSQIAGDYNTLQKLAKNEKAKEIIESHISETKAYLAEVEKIVNEFS